MSSTSKLGPVWGAEHMHRGMRYEARLLREDGRIWDHGQERYREGADVAQLVVDRIPPTTGIQYELAVVVWDKKAERFLTDEEFRAMTYEQKAERFAEVEPAKLTDEADAD